MTPAAKRSARGGILDFLAAPPTSPPPLVVLYGKEHLLADAAIDKVVAAAVPDESLRALNVDALDAQSIAAAGDIISRVSALPFLADRRVVLVRGSIDLKKEARDQIVTGCADVPEHAVLVIDHSGRPARPQGRRPKDEAGAFAGGTRGSLLLDCALDQIDAVRYVEERAAQNGLKIDAEARAMLAATEDASEIKNALDRLALTTKRVRAEDVRDYAVAPQDAKLWDLADAVRDRDVARALKLAREAGDNPVGALLWLAGDAQVIWELASGARADEYARASGQNPWRINKMIGASRRTTPKEAKRNVDITIAALEKSLSGLRDADQALDEIIVRLCEPAK